LAPAVRVFIDYLADNFVFRDRGQEYTIGHADRR
jgi:hypothetical protein